jgi:hypothetical protein
MQEAKNPHEFTDLTPVLDAEMVLPFCNAQDYAQQPCSHCNTYAAAISIDCSTT